MADDRHLIPLAGDQDGSRIDVRGIAEGTVAIGETILSIATGDGLLVDGKINVQGVPFIAIYAKGEFGTGPLTSIDIKPEFAGGGATSWAFATGLKVVEGQMTLQRAIYRIATEAIQYVFIIPNPGAIWLRFTSNATGVVTGSWLALRIMRFKFGSFQPWEE